MSTEAIRRAVEIFGSVRALAAKLGVKPPTVSQWMSGTRPVPADRCPTIEKETKGQVRCDDLRPDVDWDYLRGTAPSVTGPPDPGGPQPRLPAQLDREAQPQQQNNEAAKTAEKPHAATIAAAAGIEGVRETQEVA